MKNKILLLDIDYTIHDNSLFKTLLGIDFQSKFNISKNKTINIYKLLLNETGFFKPELFVERLSKEIGYDHKTEIKKILWQEKRFRQTLYPDTRLFLKKIQDTIDIYIFSKGEKLFQKAKIHPLTNTIKLTKVFIFKNKFKKLNDTVKKFNGKKIFIIDDSPAIINKMKSIDNKIITIMIKRPKFNKNYDYSKKTLADYVVKNLISAVKIIKSY
ncbi:MAG: hypothetical protein Q8P65_00080 [bacterium]|nr:hypothetical protein [bacterium]